MVWTIFPRLGIEFGILLCWRAEQSEKLTNSGVMNCFQKLFGIEMAEFRVTVKCMWNSETGDFELLAEGDEDTMQAEDCDEDEDDES